MQKLSIHMIPMKEVHCFTQGMLAFTYKTPSRSEKNTLA